MRNSRENRDDEDELSLVIPKDRDSPFKAPEWASLPRCKPGKTFYLEVWKSNKLIAKVNISERKAWVFGRHETYAQIRSLHDSVSRQHAVLIHCGRKRQFYLVDMKSFHGTFINDIKITAWVPVEVDSKCEIKIGGSSRLYIVREGDVGLEKEEEGGEEILPKQIAKKPRVSEEALHQPSNEKLYHCSHLLVKHKDSRNPTSWRQQGTITRTKDSAIQLLNHYKSQIDRGQFTFAELAKRYSDCSSAAKGGALAPFKEGAMQPAFEAAVKELKPGEISLVPVSTDSGVHIIFRHKV
jgi:NIMA-interacting peptidyl-prolyl cis-trans isomerase 1